MFVCAHVCRHVFYSMHLEVRGQLTGVCSLPAPRTELRSSIRFAAKPDGSKDQVCLYLLSHLEGSLLI